MPADWTGCLVGDSHSLQVLAEWFTGQQWKVTRRNDGSYCLTSPDLTACDTEDEAWQVVLRAVNLINSAAKVLEPRYAAVELGNLEHTDPDGTFHSSFTAFSGVGNAFASGVVERNPLLAESIVRLLEQEKPNSQVSRARAQWNLPKTPTSLNNILEIIRDDIWGGPPKPKKAKAAWEKMARRMACLMGVQEAQLNNDLKHCRDRLHELRHGSPRQVANPIHSGPSRGLRLAPSPHLDRGQKLTPQTAADPT